jgi:eukaryotic-like serine/threonine-protein kinase
MSLSKTEYIALPKGTILENGKYTLLDLVAVGGMGAVYKGVKESYGGFSLVVAIKELLPHLSSKRPLLDLFFSEAKLHANLNHSNIVRVVDLFEDNHRYYIVFEWVEGMDLRNAIKRMIARNYSLPIDVAIYIFYELLNALEYSHSFSLPSKEINGIIHRDISPSNILLSKAGEVKLTDFGISSAGARLNQFKRVPGKKGYMPMEQINGDIGDERTDIFSLVVCLIEALTLVNPIGYAAKYGFPLDIRKARPDISPVLENIISAGLSLSVYSRPTAIELMEQFHQFLKAEDIVINSTLLSDFLLKI